MLKNICLWCFSPWDNSETKHLECGMVLTSYIEGYFHNFSCNNFITQMEFRVELGFLDMPPTKQTLCPFVVICYDSLWSQMPKNTKNLLK